jgi:hypothetical protein
MGQRTLLRRRLRKERQDERTTKAPTAGRMR